MEGYAWLDALSKWLLERAVRKISPEDQDRCREEWRADLDSMPNTVVKLIYALRNFSSDVVDEINADCYENERFDDVIKIYRRCCEKFEALKVQHSDAVLSQEKLQHSLAVLELQAQAAESAHGVVVAHRDSTKLAVQLAGRASDLLGGRIERVGTKLSRVESLLKSVSQKRERRMIRKKESFFSVEPDRDLTALLLSLQDGNDADASARQEHEEIMAAIATLFRRQQ